jgi:hypothetical protein
MHVEWTGALVVGRLKMAFRKNPDAAIFSAPDNLSCEGPVEDLNLIQATALPLGLLSPSRIHLLYHARALGARESIYKLCQNQSWKPSTHYSHVRAASTAVAEWLNAAGYRR